MANGSFYDTRNRYSKIYVLAMISLKVMNVRVERLKYRAITRDIHLNNPFSLIGIPHISALDHNLYVFMSNLSYKVFHYIS